MLRDLVDKLRASRGVAHKRDIDGIARLLADGHGAGAVPVGDDCAAIPDGEGYLLFAIEGLLNEFVAHDPWFAGYCAVMVNASDIYSMGGRPLAITDAIWSDGLDQAATVFMGLTAAARAYGIPIVGGHTNLRNSTGQLAASIVGRATSLLTSFDARPGQVLIAAADLRGRYREPANYWDASTPHPGGTPTPKRLRDDLELLPAIAEDGLCAAAKDISMGGVVGTALMLVECSGVGATLSLDHLPMPAGVSLERWLSTFPSYGFLLSVDPVLVPEVLARFAARDLAAAVVGAIDDSNLLTLQHGQEKEVFWDLRCEGLIGFSPAASSKESVLP